MKSLSDKQLAANRANAARSTGPRTSDGKARASLNSRKHGLSAATFTAIFTEDREELANLIDDAVAFYDPQNSQEQFAVERIALAQLAILRAYRLEAGAMSSCFAGILNEPHEPNIVSDPIEQKYSHDLAQGFYRQTLKGNSWSLILRYQAQADRQYRRAVEDFARLKAEREEIPNEPISVPEPELSQSDTPAPNEPIEFPDTARSAAPAAEGGPTPGPWPLAPGPRQATIDDSWSKLFNGPRPASS